MIFFFFNDTATTEIYTLSLHDALPISHDVDREDRAAFGIEQEHCRAVVGDGEVLRLTNRARLDRKSTRLNSSHSQISYAVFCLKKKKQYNNHKTHRLTETSPPSCVLT